MKATATLRAANYVRREQAHNAGAIRRKANRMSKPGVLYLAQAYDKSFIKIGYTSNKRISHRICGLKAYARERFGEEKMIYLVSLTPGTRADETALLKQTTALRCSGNEWMVPSADVIKSFLKRQQLPFPHDICRHGINGCRVCGRGIHKPAGHVLTEADKEIEHEWNAVEQYFSERDHRRWEWNLTYKDQLEWREHYRAATKTRHVADLTPPKEKG